MTDRVIHGLEEVGAELRGCVLTIGNFDGVHLGHRRILSAGRRQADAAGAALVVLTFEPPPVAVVAPDRAPQRILPLDVKARLLAEGGADRVVVAEATAGLLALTPQGFVREVLLERFAPRAIVEGPNFRFGKGRAGSVETLRELAAEGRFEVVEVEPVRIDLPARPNVRVSSSLIRELVLAGDVVSAGRCLGRAYVLRGRVVSGEHRGRLLEFPTANVEAEGVVAPGDGVYAARAAVAGRSQAAAVSIGTKPTFGPAPRAIEVHLVDGGGDFYGRRIEVAFLERLRDQRRFPDAESLRAQIAKDVQRVRELCR